MTNIDEFTFTKITTHITLPETSFYLKIHWKNNNFDIEIFSENKKWFGTFTEADVRSYGEELNETEDDYFHKTKTILMIQSVNYSYEMNYGVFSWSKIVSLNSNRKIIQGKIELTLSDEIDSINNFIDSLLDVNKAIRDTNDVQKTMIENLQQELNNSLKDNLELVELKDNMESKLYSKFVQILNCKKKRIQLLENAFHNKDSEGIIE